MYFIWDRTAQLQFIAQNLRAKICYGRHMHTPPHTQLHTDGYTPHHKHSHSYTACTPLHTCGCTLCYRPMDRHMHTNSRTHILIHTAHSAMHTYKYTLHSPAIQTHGYILRHTLSHTHTHTLHIHMDTPPTITTHWQILPHTQLHTWIHTPAHS